MRFVKRQFWCRLENPAHIAEVREARGDGYESYVPVRDADGEAIDVAGEWVNNALFRQHWTIVCST